MIKDISYIILVFPIIFLGTEVESCFKDSNQFEEWFRSPCGGNDQFDDLKKAMLQMKIFRLVLEEKLTTNGVQSGVDYGQACPNITRLIDRLDREKKIRVFYNMLLRLSVFIHNVTNTISDDSGPQNIRKEMYSDILCHLKPVVCQFQKIQIHSRKAFKRKMYKVCTPDYWDVSYSNMFDKQFLQNFRKFFDKCFVLFKDIHYYDDKILL